MGLTEIQILVEAVTAVSALGGLLLVYWSIRSPIQEGVFLAYTARYADLLQKLPERFFDERTDHQQRATADVRHIQAYLDLCSEEVKLKLRHGVPPRVWTDWADAIRANVTKPIVLAALRDAEWGRDYQVLYAFVFAFVSSNKVSTGLAAARRVYKTPPKEPADWKGLGDRVPAHPAPGPQDPLLIRN